jgi:hypothetical protein
MALLDDIEANAGMLEWVECLSCSKPNRFRKMHLLSRDDRYVFICDECSEKEIWQPFFKPYLGDPQKMEALEAYLATQAMDEGSTEGARGFWAMVLRDAMERRRQEEEQHDDPEAG